MPAGALDERGSSGDRLTGGSLPLVRCNMTESYDPSGGLGKGLALSNEFSHCIGHVVSQGLRGFRGAQRPELKREGYESFEFC